MKKIIQITEDRLKEIAADVANRLIMEYALDLKKYKSILLSQFPELNRHILKVLVLGKDNPQVVSHWKSEIFSFAEPIVDNTLKIKGDKSKYVLQMAQDYWGVNFNEYDLKIEKQIQYLILKYCKNGNLICNQDIDKLKQDIKPKLIWFYNQLEIASKKDGDLILLDKTIEKL